MATVAMAWVLKNRGVGAPIIGAIKPKHLVDVAAARDLKLTDEESDLFDRPSAPRLPTYF